MALPLTALATLRPPKQVKAPLIRVKTIITRGETPEVVEVEANLDPLEILKAAGVGVLVGGVALAAGWLLWDGLAAPTPFGPAQIFRGAKESPFWQAEAERARRAWYHRLIERSGGIPRDARTGLSAEEAAEVILGNIGDATCQLLNREWVKAKRQGRSSDTERFLQQARENECPWVDQI